MHPLARLVVDVPDFPKPGSCSGTSRRSCARTSARRSRRSTACFNAREWDAADAVAGVESRGFILAAALAERRGKGFVPIRKKGKLPPPVVERNYSLEYGAGVLEMQRGEGRLLLIDDVLATGGTLAASAELAADAGFDVLHAGILIDLGIAKDFRCRGAAPRAVIRYGG
jgi:adenine phosphoribosyltransferase